MSEIIINRINIYPQIPPISNYLHTNKSPLVKRDGCYGSYTLRQSISPCSIPSSCQRKTPSPVSAIIAISYNISIRAARRINPQANCKSVCCSYIRISNLHKISATIKIKSCIYFTSYCFCICIYIQYSVIQPPKFCYCCVSRIIIHFPLCNKIRYGINTAWLCSPIISNSFFACIRSCNSRVFTVPRVCKPNFRVCS